MVIGLAEAYAIKDIVTIKRGLSMQALVLKSAGQAPAVDEFKEPEAGDGQQIVKVLAAGLNPYDRYVSTQEGFGVPRVVGLEGVGTLPDGSRVYFGGTVPPYGSISEQTVVPEGVTTALPAELKDGDAVAIGIAGLAGWLPLSWKAKVQPGETVLVLGATGVQGQIAVQAAKLLGAGKVIAAGRNREVLESLRSRGADDIAVLEGDLAAALKKAAPEGGYQVVIDSLFGEPFSALLDSGTLNGDSRLVEVGGAAGQEVTLNFRHLQATKGATVAGYSTFYVPNGVKQAAYLQMAQSVIDGKLNVDIKEVPLAEAATAWDMQAAGPHQKIVIVPPAS
jgi:NADPH:quinone reductase-like Zn-dependent oxidoreductase